MNLLKRIGWTILKIVGTILFFGFVLLKPLWWYLRWGLSIHIRMIRSKISWFRFGRQIARWWTVFCLIFVGVTFFIAISIGIDQKGTEFIQDKLFRLQFILHFLQLIMEELTIFLPYAVGTSIVFTKIIKTLYKKKMLVSCLLRFIEEFDKSPKKGKKKRSKK